MSIFILTVFLIFVIFLVGTKNDIPDFTFLERMKSMSTSLWNDITTKEFLPSGKYFWR